MQKKRQHKKKAVYSCAAQQQDSRATTIQHNKILVHYTTSLSTTYHGLYRNETMWTTKILQNSAEKLTPTTNIQLSKLSTNLTSDTNCGKYERGNWRAVDCSESGIQVRDLGSYRAPQYIQGTQSPLEDTLGTKHCIVLLSISPFVLHPYLFYLMAVKNTVRSRSIQPPDVFPLIPIVNKSCNNKRSVNNTL